MRLLAFLSILVGFQVSSASSLDRYNAVDVKSVQQVLQGPTALTTFQFAHISCKQRSNSDFGIDIFTNGLSYRLGVGIYLKENLGDCRGPTQEREYTLSTEAIPANEEIELVNSYIFQTNAVSKIQQPKACPAVVCPIGTARNDETCQCEPF